LEHPVEAAAVFLFLFNGPTGEQLGVSQDVYWTDLIKFSRLQGADERSDLLLSIAQDQGTLLWQPV